MAGTLLPVFEHAAISLVHRDGRIDTVASSDDVGGIVDRVQYETGQGPCLSAIRKDPVSSPATWPLRGAGGSPAAAPWPRPASDSMLSLRLFLGRTPCVPSALYSRSVDVFDDRAQAFGQVLAAHAAIAMSAADDHEEVEHLEEALSSSRVIGTAQGILMVQVKVDRAQAFRILVQGSQRLNIKLRALAARIVSAEEEHHRGAPTRPKAPRPRKALRSAAAERAWSVGARRRSSKGSGKGGDQVGHGDQGAGEERHLLAHVHPRLRGPQLAHQVDDAVQLVGLERQHPLVVVQRERGDGVGPDVGVAAGLHAVLHAACRGAPRRRSRYQS